MCDITVTDTAHPSHLRGELATMWREEEMFDYTIKGQQRTFRIHSVVLAAMSPMFKGMLRSDMGEAKKKEATFPTISDELLVAVIEFAYTGTCTLAGDNWMGLIEAAHFLQMIKLMKLCQKKIPAAIRPDNCFAWSTLVSKFQIPDITPKIDHLKWASYKDVIATTEFKQLTISDFMQYLKDVREYGTSCDDLLHGMISWIKHDQKKRSEYTRDVLRMIPISDCSGAVIKQVLEEHRNMFSTQIELMFSELLNNFTSKPLRGDQSILISGGMSAVNEVNSKCWEMYEGEMEECSSIQEDQACAKNHSVCRVPHGIMMTGGENSNECLLFSFKGKMWTKLSAMLGARHSHGSDYIKGKVFVIGGYIQGSLSVTVQFLDMENDVWRQGQKLPAKVSAVKTISYQGSLFVLSTDIRNWYRLNVDGEMSWSTLAPIPQASTGCSLAASDDRIFATGGSAKVNYLYMPVIDQWCRLKSPSIAESQGSLVYYAQRLYLFPGCVASKELVDVEEYDVTTDSWSLNKWKMPQPLCYFRAFLINVRG